MIRLSNFAYLVLLSHHLFLAQIGSTRGFALFPKFPLRDGKALNASNSESFELVPLPKKVAVAGATGRTGRLVVEELLKRDIDVVALVRDLKKAKETLPTDEVGKLTVKVCDFSNKKELLAGKFIQIIYDVKWQLFNLSQIIRFNDFFSCFGMRCCALVCNRIFRCPRLQYNRQTSEIVHGGIHT